MPAIPKTGTRSAEVDPELRAFLSQDEPDLHLGGGGDFHAERNHHAQVLGFHALDVAKRAPISAVEFTAIRGPHGTIPVRVFYPHSSQAVGSAAALIYFHGGGYTVGTVDEFENGCRLVAERAGAQVYAVEYRLAPEWRFPTQLDEYVCVLEWVRGEGGRERGVDPTRVCGGGDSADGNMTAALCLRLRDEGKEPLRAQLLLYPEARLPFDTPAAAENNSGLYLECEHAASGLSGRHADSPRHRMRRQRYFLVCGPLPPTRRASVPPIRFAWHATCHCAKGSSTGGCLHLRI
jgi:acetyl esterase/lipase